MQDKMITTRIIKFCNSFSTYLGDDPYIIFKAIDQGHWVKLNIHVGKALTPHILTTDTDHACLQVQKCIPRKRWSLWFFVVYISLNQKPQHYAVILSVDEQIKRFYTTRNEMKGIAQ